MRRKLSSSLGECEHHARRIVKPTHVASVERDLPVRLEAGERNITELLRNAEHTALEVGAEDEVATDAIEDNRAGDGAVQP